MMKSNPMMYVLFLPISIGIFVYFSGVLVNFESYKQEVKSEAYHHIDEQVSSVAILLTELSKEITECNNINVERMREVEFYDLNTRLIGWVEKDRIECSSDIILNSTLKVIPDVTSSHDYDVDFELQKVTLPSDETLLVLVFWDGKKVWFAVLEPWLMNLNDECKGCSSIAVGKSYENEDDYSFYIGDILFKSYFNDQKIKEYVQPQSLRVSVFSAVTSLLVLITLFLYRLSNSNAPDVRLRNAIKNREIVPYFQLIFDARTGKSYLCEVLARWKSSNSEMMPNEFIPLAESTGSIDELMLSLIKQTSEMVDAHPMLLGDIVFSFNVTPSQLERKTFVHQLLQSATMFKRHHIVLEVTEREAFIDLKIAKETIRKLKDAGIEVELDDAGTGYGSFSYIQQLDISTLKIDKMFVDTIEHVDLKRQVLDGIIAFCRDAEITVIAEGVESKKQVDFLLNKGVYYHQGYYYHKPSNMHDLLVKIKSISDL